MNTILYHTPLHLAQWLGRANIKVHVAADLLKGESFGRLRRRFLAAELDGLMMEC